MTRLEASLWPAERLSEALASCLPDLRMAANLPRAPANPGNAESVESWIEATAPRLGLEVVAFESSYSELTATLAATGPALLRVRYAARETFLVCMASTRRRLALLGPDHVERSVAVDEVQAIVAQCADATVAGDLEALARQNLAVPLTAAVEQALRTAKLRDTRINVGWLVRKAARRSLRDQVREAKLPGSFARFLLIHLAGHLAWILAWLAIGADALQGRLDGGRLSGAGLLLAAFAACSVAADRWHALLALRLGTLLRRRLLEGALALDAQSARGAGAGEFLGRIYESHALESLSVSGGLAAVTGTIEWIAALVILIWAGTTWSLPVLLVVFAALCAWLSRLYLRERREWTVARRGLTRRLIENMVGHRTHLVQSNEASWQSEEDRQLASYLETSRHFDRKMWLLSLLPRLWLLVAAALFGWLFIVGTPTPTLAVTIAGILLAFESLRHLMQGLPQVAGAAIAFEAIQPMMDAASRPASEGSSAVSPEPYIKESPPDVPLLDGQHLAIRTASGDRQLLEDATLVIRRGDRVLLEGASGGGKSTLASVLAGLRQPDRGVLLLGGLDLATLGESAWRRRVALAAQFHENHIVSATLAFNLLMGRQWPPTAADYRQAETICRELGLGDLLDRMPGGLDQVVGESGWQLSHGEKSRIYLARALLQHADLVILDETLAALDPETLDIALSCAVKRAPALVVVAHP